MPLKPLVLTVSGLVLAISLLFFFEKQWNPPNAPDVTFKTITNQSFSLQQLKGRPVIITFWATDCRSCIAEIPHWKQLYRQYHDKGLEIIAVAMYYDPPNRVVNMSRELQLPYPVVLDLKAEIGQAFGNVKLTPASFLISPKGKIVMDELGVLDFEDLERRILELLNRQ